MRLAHSIFLVSVVVLLYIIDASLSQLCICISDLCSCTHLSTIQLIENVLIPLKTITVMTIKSLHLTQFMVFFLNKIYPESFLILLALDHFGHKWHEWQSHHRHCPHNCKWHRSPPQSIFHTTASARRYRTLQWRRAHFGRCLVPSAKALLNKWPHWSCIGPDLSMSVM